MNKNIKDFQTLGILTVPYPPNLRMTVTEAQECWENFCGLHDEIKRKFPYKKERAGVGYEDKRVSGRGADMKEVFDLTLKDKDWLEEKAKELNHPVVTAFIHAASLVAELEAPSMISFAGEVENEFSIEDLKNEVAESANDIFIRFIHYFPVDKIEQETAEAHTDLCGMTGHLFSSAPGFQYLTKDMKWEEMPVAEDGMVVIPSMGLQYRSEGLLKATVHRVISTPETMVTGRYSAVAFTPLIRTPKIAPSTPRMQQLHKEDLGFNYHMNHNEFKKLFA
jgi:isopenicillin N synthase-like dioxygenase